MSIIIIETCIHFAPLKLPVARREFRFNTLNTLDTMVHNGYNVVIGANE